MMAQASLFAAIRKAKLAPVLAALLHFPLAGIAAPYFASGTVVHVDDGDTLVILSPGKTTLKVRLASIDAPEASHAAHEKGRVGQPYSSRATEHLEALVKGRAVDLKCFERDRYNREICELFIGAESVNRAMVSAGWAWANQSSKGRYLRDTGLVALEEKARAAGRGLWAGRSPVPPWEWRTLCWQNQICQ